MKIGIIGAGIVGRAVGKLAVRAGHEVMLSNSRDPNTLFSLGYAVGASVGTAEEAARFGEVVLVAVPLSAYRALPAAPLAGKIVLDANNYYHERDGRIPALDEGRTTTSELIAAHLTGARVVKAFNSIIMSELETDGRPAGAADRRAIPIAGDDAAGKAVATRLLDDLGFDTVDAGPLSEGWRFERDRPAYCARLDKHALERALAETRREAAA